MAHLAGGCATCRERLTFLKSATAGIAAAIQADQAGAASLPSESARSYARALTRLRYPAPVAPQGSSSRLQRWIAHLIPQIDPSAGSLAPATGLRNALPAEPVSGQRLYETEAHMLTLWEEPTKHGVNGSPASSYVIGQIYGREDGICLVPESVLFTAQFSGEVCEARLEDGEFHAAKLLPGAYLVQCWLPDADGVIVLRDVVIGGATPLRTNP